MNNRAANANLSKILDEINCFIKICDLCTQHKLSFTAVIKSKELMAEINLKPYHTPNSYRWHLLGYGLDLYSQKIGNRLSNFIIFPKGSSIEKPYVTWINGQKCEYPQNYPTLQSVIQQLSFQPTKIVPATIPQSYSITPTLTIPRQNISYIPHSAPILHTLPAEPDRTKIPLPPGHSLLGKRTWESTQQKPAYQPPIQINSYSKIPRSIEIESVPLKRTVANITSVVVPSTRSNFSYECVPLLTSDAPKNSMKATNQITPAFSYTNLTKEQNAQLDKTLEMAFDDFPPPVEQIEPADTIAPTQPIAETAEFTLMTEQTTPTEISPAIEQTPSTEIPSAIEQTKQTESASPIEKIIQKELTPSEQTSILNNIKIKEEPVELPETDEHPILILNQTELLTVINILAGKRNTASNCTSLSEGIINYFKTSKLPTKAASLEFSLAHFSVNYAVQNKLVTPIKQENSVKKTNSNYIQTITTSIIDRNTLFGSTAGCDVNYQQINGVMDLTQPILDVDSYTQKSIDIANLNTALKYEASRHPLRISFGTICLGHCGKHIDNIGHMLVYYATPLKVTFIDAQLYHAGKSIFNELSTEFFFLGYNRQRNTVNTFGRTIFYTHLGPLAPAQNMSPKI